MGMIINPFQVSSAASTAGEAIGLLLVLTKAS